MTSSAEQLAFIGDDEFRSEQPAIDLDENYTPPDLFKWVEHEFGLLTLDPCAVSAIAAKCGTFYTPTDNGLVKPWAPHRVWLNPPYSNVGPWLAKVRLELKAGCPLVVALLPNWTDRKWWHNYIEPFRGQPGGPEVRFLEGRIRFGCPGNPTGVGRDSFSHGNALVIWRAP